MVIDAAPYVTIPFRLSQNLFKALLFVGVPADLAAAEAHAMETPQIAASNSRSVLGTLKQFGYMVECDLHYQHAHSAVELNRRLAKMVVIEPKHIGFPVDRVREAFGLAPSAPDIRRPPGVVLH